MRLKELCEDRKLRDIMETASGGSTAAGSIANLPNAMGTVIRRMPTEPNLFGYVAPRKKSKKKSKNHR